MENIERNHNDDTLLLNARMIIPKNYGNIIEYEAVVDDGVSGSVLFFPFHVRSYTSISTPQNSIRVISLVEFSVSYLIMLF